MSSMILELTDETVANTIKQNEIMVLAFSAPWCGSCKMMIPMWETLSTSNVGLTIGKVNVDENAATSVEYNISGLPTILFLKNGQVVDKQNGPAPKSIIQAKINSLMN